MTLCSPAHDRYRHSPPNSAQMPMLPSQERAAHLTSHGGACANHAAQAGPVGGARAATADQHTQLQPHQQKQFIKSQPRHLLAPGAHRWTPADGRPAGRVNSPPSLLPAAVPHHHHLHYAGGGGRLASPTPPPPVAAVPRRHHYAGGAGHTGSPPRAPPPRTMKTAERRSSTPRQGGHPPPGKHRGNASPPSVAMSPPYHNPWAFDLAAAQGQSSPAGPHRPQAQRCGPQPPAPCQQVTDAVAMGSGGQGRAPAHHHQHPVGSSGRRPKFSPPLAEQDDMRRAKHQPATLDGGYGTMASTTNTLKTSEQLQIDYLINENRHLHHQCLTLTRDRDRLRSKLLFTHRLLRKAQRSGAVVAPRHPAVAAAAQRAAFAATAPAAMGNNNDAALGGGYGKTTSNSSHPPTGTSESSHRQRNKVQHRTAVLSEAQF